jgi:hypothetical protein
MDGDVTQSDAVRAFKEQAMTSISHVVQKIKEQLAERRAGRPERMQRRAEAKAHRLEMKRAHETDMRGGGGGGG